MRAHLVVGLVLFALGSLAARAAADVVPPEEEECRARRAGDACTLAGQAGACQDSTCSRLDYTDGTPPGTVEYPCVTCVPGATATTPPATPAGGCSVIPGGAPVGGAAWLALLLLVGLRRRS